MTRFVHAEHFAHALDEAKAGVVGLHHHVHQQHGEVAVAGEQMGRLLATEHLMQLDLPVEDDSVPERVLQRGLEVGVVVDGEHAPGFDCRGGG